MLQQNYYGINGLPLMMQFAKTIIPEKNATEYAYNDMTQKPEYRLDWVIPYKTKLSGGWTWDQKKSKTPPKPKK